MKTKKCPWCKKTKPLDEFTVIRDKGKGTAPTRHHTRCKPCDSLANRCTTWAPIYFGLKPRSEKLQALPRKKVREMHLKFRQYLVKQYGSYSDTALDQYIQDNHKKGRIEIPEDEIKSEEFMEIVLGIERKKHNNKQISRAQISYGYVYGVWNTAPHWDGWVKAGRSGIMKERLSGYQTADHLRGFKPLYKVLVLDRYAGEKLVLNYFKGAGYEVRGEWIRVDHATFIWILNWMAEDPEFNADEILDEYRLWKEKRAA